MVRIMANYFDSPSQWNIFLNPPKGTDIHSAARMSVKFRREVNQQVSGFVFNDVVIGIGDDDTVDTVIKKYYKQTRCEDGQSI